ncbi:MAG: NAD(P)/FAD-dependent oxidoreductase [bacterium]
MHTMIDRRDFLKSFLASIPVLSLDWDSFPIAHHAHSSSDSYDVIVIGSGLGGLSCATAFARQGFKALVIEQHSIPGGYATAFSRPGGFLFDVSLHSTTIGSGDPAHKLIPGFPELDGPEFIQHPSLYRAIFPEHDIIVAQKNLPAYIAQLVHSFPEEKIGIEALFATMQGLGADIQKLSAARGKVDMSKFPQEFPTLFANYMKTWGQMVDAHLKNNTLKAIVSAQWGYYGLPPSKLSSFYYALPTYDYLVNGGAYPRGRSQDLSNAFVRFIEAHGGKMLLGTKVEKVLVEKGAAVGVVTKDRTEYKSKVVVSNASSLMTFQSMIDECDGRAAYLKQLEKYKVSLSSFQIFLGLNKELVKEAGVKDSEIFIASGYDHEKGYEQSLRADVTDGGCGVTIYDNIYEGYSPKGKNTLNIMVLQGYDYWEKYEGDYFNGNKTAYRKAKEEMAGKLIESVEKRLLPGLSSAIEVKEIGTPLTNLRYTGNYRGAIYGWDQTLGNSGNSRVGHSTPIKNLFLAGAWSRPGHGYGAVIPSGLECFGEIMNQWK